MWERLSLEGGAAASQRACSSHRSCGARVVSLQEHRPAACPPAARLPPSSRLAALHPHQTASSSDGGQGSPSKKKPKGGKYKRGKESGISSNGTARDSLVLDNGALLAPRLSAPLDVVTSEYGEEEDFDEEGEDTTGILMDAVVKVFCVHTEPNYGLPWQRLRQYTSTSTGFMVAGEEGQRWLLTNAHSVQYHSQVKVKRRGDDEKFLARVLAVGPECDIALLTVDDDCFWENVTPLSFGPLPALQDAVAVVGYPIGV